MVISGSIWQPFYGEEIIIPHNLLDALAVYLPVDCSLTEHNRATELNQLAESFAHGEVSLEEYMDTLNDEGIDAEKWIGRAEWLYSEALSFD